MHKEVKKLNQVSGKSPSVIENGKEEQDHKGHDQASSQVDVPSLHRCERDSEMKGPEQGSLLLTAQQEWEHQHGNSGARAPKSHGAVMSPDGSCSHSGLCPM